MTNPWISPVYFDKALLGRMPPTLVHVGSLEVRAAPLHVQVRLSSACIPSRSGRAVFMPALICPYTVYLSVVSIGMHTVPQEIFG